MQSERKALGEKSVCLLFSIVDAIAHLPGLVRAARPFTRKHPSDPAQPPMEDDQQTSKTRIEEVFLINPISGLLIHHFSYGRQSHKNPAAVSAMLTAIQDFVADSFGGTKPLDMIKCGDCSLLIKKREVVLAIAVTGHVTDHISHQLARGFEKLHQEFGEQLHNLENPSPPLKSKLQKRISAYLSNRYRLVTSHRFRRTAVASLLSTSFVWSLVAWHLGSENDAHQPEIAESRNKVTKDWLHLPNKSLALITTELNKSEQKPNDEELLAFLRDLDNQPGIDITSHEKNSENRIVVRGHLDDHALSPQKLADRSNFDPGKFEFRLDPIISNEPEIVRRRIIDEIRIPTSIEFYFEDNCIHFFGSASRMWVEQAIVRCQRRLGGFLVDASGVQIQ